MQLTAKRAQLEKVSYAGISARRYQEDSSEVSEQTVGRCPSFAFWRKIGYQAYTGFVSISDSVCGLYVIMALITHKSRYVQGKTGRSGYAQLVNRFIYTSVSKEIVSSLSCQENKSRIAIWSITLLRGNFFNIYFKENGSIIINDHYLFIFTLIIIMIYTKLYM